MIKSINILNNIKKHKNKVKLNLDIIKNENKNLF